MLVSETEGTPRLSLHRHEALPWQTWAAVALCASFAAVASILALLRHAAFNTNLFDLGYYTQVIWNTAHGHWFATSLKPGLFLADHFSPILLVLTPFFWLAPDARTLLVIECMALAAAVAPVYLILRPRHPSLALLVTAACILNPMLHRTATYEFHEIMLAAPTLAFAAYALHRKRTSAMLIALALTLLVREDMGIYIVAFGLYYLLRRPGQRWVGALLIGGGLAWFLVLTMWVMPLFGGGEYRHVAAFIPANGADGIAALLREPSILVQRLVAPEKILALGRILLPLALLPLLGMGEQMLWLLPTLGLLLVTNRGAGTLQEWYVAPLLPLLFATAAMSLTRLTPRAARLWSAALLVTSIGSYLLLSPFPGGRKFQAAQYRTTQHNRLGRQVLSRIPANATVAAESGLGAHLGARETLFLFPRFSEEAAPQLVILDATGHNSYPFEPAELPRVIAEYQMDPNKHTVWEQDSYYIFELGKVPDSSAWQPATAQWGAWLKLEGYEVAETDAGGAFLPAAAALTPGRTLRVALYLTTLERANSDYAISARLVAPDGRVVAIQDDAPARGQLPATRWPTGATIRDTHYLSLPAEPWPGVLELRVVVYDPTTLQTIGPESGQALSSFVAQ